jgi:PAP2 superfamily
MQDIETVELPAEWTTSSAGPERQLRPRWTREVLLIAGLYLLYYTSRGVRHGNLGTAERNGLRILRWEQALHLDPEHALNNWFWHIYALGVAGSYFYALLIWVVTPLVLIWLYRRHPASYRPARTTVALATGLALLVYLLLPTAPPRLLPGAHFHDILVSTHQWGWWSGEGGDAPRGVASTANQLAAMPSMHVGWAVWSGWLIARHARYRWAKVLGSLYPILLRRRDGHSQPLPT